MYLERVSFSSFLVVFHSPKQSPNPNEKQGHVRCSGGGVFGSLNHSSASNKNMFRNWVSQFN